MKDTYKTWKIEDDLTFLLEYKKAFHTMIDKDGKYGNFLFLYGKYLLSKFISRGGYEKNKVNKFIQARVGRGI